MAIPAVVRGGASISGGRGTVLGTVLGLLAIVVLQNGLRLSGQPAELAGILTRVPLVGTILADPLSTRDARPRPPETATEVMDGKNSQPAVACGTIPAAPLLVVARNR